MKPRNSIPRILAGPGQFFAFGLAVFILAIGSHAAIITKAATGTDLTDGASWTGSTAPGSGDVANWASTSLGASLTMGTSSSWSGINVVNALGAIGVTGAGPLTLGAGGIDMSVSTVNLTLGTPITLGASQIWNVNSGRTLVASGIISGTGMGLTKSGVGTLTLTGANTYDGATTILGGTLVADTASAATILNSASGLTFTSSGTFQLKGLASNVQSQILNGLTLTSGAAIIDANNTGTSTTIDLRGAGGTLTITRSAGTTVDFKASAGTLGATAIVNTAQANDGTGILGAWATVNTGADWAINNGSNVAAAYTAYNTLSATTLATGGTVNYRVATNPTTPTGNITMAATGTIDVNTLRISDAAVRTIDVRNSTTQGILRFGVVGGLLTSGGNHIIGVSGTNTVGTITAGGSTANNPGELVVNNASNLTINSVIANNGTGAVTLTKSGAGTLSVGNNNAYTGNTTINAGTLAFVDPGSFTPANNNSALGTSATKIVTIQSGATLSVQRATLTGAQLIMNGGKYQDNNGYGSTWNGDVILNANSFFDGTGNAGTVTINGNLSGVGGFTRTGPVAQLWVFNGVNTYTGPTIITSGIVQFPTPASLYNSADANWTPAKITVGSTGTLQIKVGGTGFSATQVATLLGNLTTGTNNNGFRDGSFFGVDTTNGAFVLSANITDSTGTGGGAVGFKKYNANALELTGTNTYSGKTTIDQGTLKVSSLNYITSGTLTPNTSSSLGKPTTVANGTIALGNGGNNNSATLIYAGSGETTDRILNLASQTATFVLDQSGAGLLKFTSPLTLQAAAKTLTLQGSTAGTGELPFIIPDPNPASTKLTLNKGGTGTWTLSNANTYTGVTTVSGGALVLGNATALPGGIGVSGGLSPLTFNGGVIGLGAGDFTRSLTTAGVVAGVNFTGNGGWAAYGADHVVNLGGASATVAWATANTGLNTKTLILGNATATHTVDFQNPLDLGGATRTVQVDKGAAAIDGKLSGSLTNGNLTKTGLGTLALTGSNSYAGATTVSGGTLLVNGPNSGTGLITVNSGATLGGTGSIAGAATFSTGGKAVFTVTRDPVTLANTTPLTITGTMTYNATEVHLNLPTGLPSGIYTLATSSATPAGTVALTPVVDSGSFAAGYTSAEVSLDTVNNKLLLTVNGLPTNPTQLAITSVNGGASPFAGAGFSVVVQAQDTNGATRQVLADTAVTLSLNSGSGPLGGVLTGTILAGNISATISGVTYGTAESNVTLTATATSGDSLTAANSALFTVLPSTTPAYLTVTGFPSPQTAGSPGSVTVTAHTASGTTATTYTGTVHFTSTAVLAGLPADYTFVSGDNGVHSFSGVTLNTAGTQALTATDTVTPSITGTQTGITVNPAAATAFIVAGYPSPRSAGVAGSVTVTAKDAYNNTDTAYVGTIQFSSSDVAASLPAIYTFTGGDAGVHTFTDGVTLNTLGVQSITATDTVTPAITGTQSAITVWVPPTNFTWRSSVNGNWSDATKWAQTSGLDYAPVTAGQADYTLNFIAGIYTATQNLSNGFLVNQLNFAGAVTIDGTNALALTGTLPTVNQNSVNGVVINPPVSLEANASVAGTGSGQVDLAGLVSGTGSLTKSTPGVLKIYGLVPNTYSGGTIISSGTLHVGTMVAGVSPLCTGVLGTGTVTLGSGTTIEFDRVSESNALVSNGGTIFSNNGWGSVWSGLITLNANTTFNATFNLACSGGVSGTGELIKTGGATLTLSNTITYTGNTTVSAGTLSINSAYLADTSTVNIASGAKLDLNTAGASDTIATLILGGVTVPAGTYNSTHLTYGTYFTGTGSLVVGSPYDTWAGGAAFDTDTNNDGVKNGLAWLLGAPNKDADATGLLPKVSPSAGALVLTFDCLGAPARDTALLKVQYSNDLGHLNPWTDALVPSVTGSSDVGGVHFEVTAPGSLLHVVATISSSGAAAGKLFGRVEANQP